MLIGRHDEAPGIEAAVSDAAGKGARTAALIAGRSSSLVKRARIAHSRRTLARHGIALSRAIQGDHSCPSGLAAGEALAAGPGLPDAVFCTSDAAARDDLDAQWADSPGGQPARFRLYGFDDILLLGPPAPIRSPRPATTRHPSCTR